MLVKVCILFLVLGFITSIPLSCTGYCGYQTITVSGKAQKSFELDTVYLTIYATAYGNTTSKAISKLAQFYNKIAGVLSSNCLNNSNYQTQSFYVYPNTSFVNGSLVTYGQIAQEQILLTVSNVNPLLDTGKVGKIFDGLAKLNGIIINSLQFALVNKTSALTILRALAYQNAVNRAKDYCSAAKVTLGGVLTIFDQSYLSPQVIAPSPTASGSSSDFVPTTVDLGLVSISYYVNAIFAFS